MRQKIMWNQFPPNLSRLQNNHPENNVEPVPAKSQITWLRYTWNHCPLLEGRSRAWQLCLLHQVQKKWMEKLTELLMTNLTSTRESRRARRPQKVI
jgi:hypothetical protein